jgi:hypothetical protein
LGTTTHDSISLKNIGKGSSCDASRGFPSTKLFCSPKLFSFASSAWHKNPFSYSFTKTKSVSLSDPQVAAEEKEEWISD